MPPLFESFRRPFLSLITKLEIMTATQKKMLRYGTLKWKTALKMHANVNQSKVEPKIANLVTICFEFKYCICDAVGVLYL